MRSAALAHTQAHTNIYTHKDHTAYESFNKLKQAHRVRHTKIFTPSPGPEVFNGLALRLKRHQRAQK